MDLLCDASPSYWWEFVLSLVAAAAAAAVAVEGQ